jgi:prephenate dehydrogenase
MGRIAIIGLGLIGGSIGLALRRAEPENTHVIGYDIETEVMTRAHRAGVVQSIAPTLQRAVSDATMVVLATPIISTRKVMQEIAPYLQKGVVITDTASTKSDVLEWADEVLPSHAYFVGGHPMAGKEKMGLHMAEESLFDDKPYCIVPSVQAIPGAVNAVVGFVQALRARPFFLDADEHDSYAAAVSHLPLLTSVALFNLVRRSNAWPELANISGTGFRDLTRLASGEPEMSHDIFMTNRENVVHWLQRYIHELQRLSDLIDSKEEGETLYRALLETQIERDKFLEKLPERFDAVKSVEFPSSKDAFVTLLTGTLWQERAKEIQISLEDQSERIARERRVRRHLDD